MSKNKNNGYNYNYQQSADITKKAVRMAGNTLDLTNPSDAFKWRTYAESMLKLWDRKQVNYQLMVEMEPDLILYCFDELTDYVAFYVKGGK